MRKQRDESGLPPQREKAQRKREAELMSYVEGSRSLDRNALIREIRAQLQIIKDDRDALAEPTTSAADRAAIRKQIEMRAAKVKLLINRPSL